MSKAIHAPVRLLLAFGFLASTTLSLGVAIAHKKSPAPGAHHVNILEMARTNDAYRRVIATGTLTQTVVMSIPPGGDIGEEKHGRVEQILFCAEGTGQAVINGVASPFRPGDVVVIPPGTRHNFLNTGAEPLKIYTIYAPPNHIPGRVQMTKADAEADEEDNAFGARVEEGRAGAQP